MTGVTMARHDLGAGEAAERSRARRKWLMLGALFLAGLPVGFLIGQTETDHAHGYLVGTLPPLTAIVAAAVTLLAIIGGSLLLRRRHDEFERRDNDIASAMGANALISVYLPWYLLWRGGLLPEPGHEAMIAVVIVASLGTFGFLKLRNRF